MWGVDKNMVMWYNVIGKYCILKGICMKVIEYLIEKRREVLIGIIAVIMASSVVGLIGYAKYVSDEDERYFNSLTPQQQQEYIIEKEAEEKARREANISRYEIVSVFRYIKVETNQFGGVTGTDICYAFEYLDKEGKIHSIDNFENLEAGLTKVIIGDKNMYIIDRNGMDEYRYLQLTEDTLSKMETK
jgi:hypothetical protein